MMRIILLFPFTCLLLLGSAAAPDSKAFAGFQWAPPSSQPVPPREEQEEQKEQPVMLHQSDDLSQLPVVENAAAARVPVIQRQNLQPSPVSPREQENQTTAPPQSEVVPVAQIQTPEPGAPVSLLKPQPYDESVIRQQLQTPATPQEQAPQQAPVPSVVSEAQDPSPIKTITRRAQTRKAPEERVSPATIPLAKPAITILAKLPEDRNTYSPVSGFGSDLPLAIALSQIVPPQYGYVPVGNINLGQRVSWSGNNRPWSIVLEEILAPHGLEPEIRGNKVLLQRAGTRQRNGTAIVDTTIIEGQAAQKTIVAPAETEVPAPTTLTITTQPSNSAGSNAEVPPAPAQPRSAINSYSKGEKLWQAAQGESLRTILTAWSQRAGFALVWQSPQDFHVNSDILVTGSFENAIDILMNYGVGKSAPNYTIKPTNNDTEPGVVVVQG